MAERLDMSEFEQQFDSSDKLSPLMPNEDFEKLAFLKERIEDISGVIELRKVDVEKIGLKQIAINQVIKRLEKMLTKLRERRYPLDKQIHALETQNRDDKRTAESLTRELARLIAELEARQRLLERHRALEDATSDFPWRVGVNGKKALPHQIEGAHRLVSAGRAILGDKPGLGKTLEAIMTIDLLRAQGKGQKVLIFTPKSVVKDFERAFKLWTNPTFIHVLNQTLKGIKSELLEAISHMPEAIVITNYEVWRKDVSIKHKLIACGFDTIVLDEAHVLKGAKSVTTQGIREIVYAENLCPKCGGQDITSRGFDQMCATCEYIQENFSDFCSVKNSYFMTGTPILNKPQELWPPLNMIDRQGFPSEKAFLNDYCTKEYDYQNDRYYWSFGSGGSERLLKKLGMKYTARTRESAGVEMPPQEIKHHYLELDPEKYPRQSKFIEVLRENARLAFSDEHQMTMQATLAWYTRMRQAASWPDGIKIKGCPHDPQCFVEQPSGEMVIECYAPEVIFPPKDAPPVGESILLDESEDIIAEAVESGDRIVVFSMFRSVLEELERRCEARGLRHAKLVGGMPEKVRQANIDDFNANQTTVGEHKYDVLFCQYQTAKVGLNLHGAQQLLCVEREWNPGMEEQTIDRLRRIDSQFNSTVHLLHCAGTATELIDAIQEQKKGMLDGFEADVNLAEAMRKFLEG
jgi:SNF2 family DNA or RNA helicase